MSAIDCHYAILRFILPLFRFISLRMLAHAELPAAIVTRCHAALRRHATYAITTPCTHYAIDATHCRRLILFRLPPYAE